MCVVVDRGGTTRLLLTDDRLGPVQIETALRKAYTAAVTGVPSSFLAALADDP